MPAPLCIFVFVIAVAIHTLNFIPAVLWPKVNVYKYINYHHYHGFYYWTCSKNCCSFFERCKRKEPPECKSSDFTSRGKSVPLSIGKKRLTRLNAERIDLGGDHQEECEINGGDAHRLCLCCNQHEKKADDKSNDEQVRSESTEKDKYKIVTRRRILRYYLLTFCCCCRETFAANRFNSYHKSCYSSILTRRGAKQKMSDRDINSVHGMTISEYLALHKKRLDPKDVALLKKLTMDTLFCHYCYKPFDPKNLEEYLLTPFWALSEILSVYCFFFILYIPLFFIYGFFALIEKCQEKCGGKDNQPKTKHYDVQHEGEDYTTYYDASKSAEI